MAISNAGELISAITGWLARAPDSEDSVVERIPDFIRLAEVRFYKRLRTPQNMFRSTALINEPRERVPELFLELESLAYMAPIPAESTASKGETHALRYVSPIQFYESSDDVEGDPFFYTIVGPEISFGPFIDWDVTVPADELGSIELVYFAASPTLDTTVDTDTNDILLHYPDIYLYGSLIESQAYIIASTELFTRWTQLYASAIEEANDTLSGATMAPAAIIRPVAVV